MIFLISSNNDLGVLKEERKNQTAGGFMALGTNNLGKSR